MLLDLSFQQHLPAYPIAVLVLKAKTNRLSELGGLVPELLVAIDGAQPGAARLIGR